MSGPTTTADATPHVVIAGAGMAGLSAAAALAGCGWRVHVVERRPAGEAAQDAGAGLQMSPNASRCLEAIGALNAVAEAGVRPRAAVLCDGRSGRLVYRAALDEAAVARWGAPYVHVHRADLAAILRDAAEVAGAVSLHGRSVTGWTQRDGAIRPEIDGAAAPDLDCDLLLVADGTGSRLRATLGIDDPARFTGQTAWRALVPADVPGLAIPPDATVWAAPGRHVVTYRVRRGSLINLVAVEEQTRWTEEGWQIEGDPSALRRAFADLAAPLRDLMAAVETVSFWGLRDRDPPQCWFERGVALIGDACHPMLPFMAQGAAMALEDGAALVRHLGVSRIVQNPRGGERARAIDRALASWQRERAPRVARVVAMARANAVLFHRHDGLRRSLSHALIGTVSRLAPSIAAGRLDWLYGYDAVNGRHAAP
ncbi:MAG: FAD-dependent monooxygenase [Pseudomonadota bacterium]